jgi:hypothetical protein
MNDKQARPAQPILGDPTVKYFLDRSGVPTKRMANVSGKGHFEIAQSYVDVERANLYDQMAKLGFARVQETTKELHVEAKNLKNRAEELGVELVVNSAQFAESRDPRAEQVVSKLLA